MLTSLLSLNKNKAVSHLTVERRTRQQTANTIKGGSGNDAISGGDGLDTLYGEGGADTFLWEAATAYNNIDVVKDFTSGSGNDALDLSDLLGLYNGTDPIADWVEITTNGSNSVVKVDRDGTGGTYSLTQIATLEGVTGLTDEAALVTNGNLIVV
jgi:Ca2+-binding RTX toxin-like protein